MGSSVEHPLTLAKIKIKIKKEKKIKIKIKEGKIIYSSVSP